MKKLTYLLCIVALLGACKKNAAPVEQQKQAIDFKNNIKTSLSGAGGSELCELCTTNDPPSQYTGYSAATMAVVMATAPGFHIYPDTAYDAGWAEGYADALYWVNYYSTGICSYYGKISIEGGPNGSTLVPIGTPLQPGTQIIGAFITNDCTDGELSWVDLRCRLTHNCGPRGLKEQYYYNTTYPGVNTDQHSFDMGRYTAFATYTTLQPLSPAPGP